MTEANPPEQPKGPAPPEPPIAPGRRSAAMVIPLAVIGFLATFILLFGLANLSRPSEGGIAGRSPSAPSAGSSSRASSLVSAGSSEASAAPLASVGASAGASVPASPLADPVLVGAGDIADCGLTDDSATAALVDAIPGAVFTAGDNAYPDGSAAQFRDCYQPTWGRFLARTRPAPGNHDWVTKGLAGYLGYFGAAAAPHGTSWYSYDLGAWHVVVLDSDCSSVGGCGADSVQGLWLAADLQASTARCTLAIWHHPRFSSGEHGNDSGVAPFWQTLYDGGADLVINGHDHDYERFAPQDPNGRPDAGRGIREFVVGTGGAALRGFSTTAPNSELRAALVHGVIRLVLHPTSYAWTFLPASGTFSDSGNGTCH
jgi:hypothetical protein